MTILDLFKIVELKKAVSEKFGVKLHAHDACPAQYFTFDDKMSEDMKNFIIEKTAEYKMKPVFDADGKSFYLEDK